MIASAKAPCRRLTWRRHRLLRRLALLKMLASAGARRPRCRSRSVNLWPALPSSSRSSWKFSMMPLWTTATLSVACGWALSSVGRAVRRPARVADADRARERLLRQQRLEIVELALGAAALDAGRRPWSRCRPNHSRDIPAASARRAAAARPSRLPMIPMIPHMLASVFLLATCCLLRGSVAAQPGLSTCSPRASASASAGDIAG